MEQLERSIIRIIKQKSNADLEKEDQAVMKDQRMVENQMEKVAKEYKEVFDVIGRYEGPPDEI